MAENSLLVAEHRLVRNGVYQFVAGRFSSIEKAFEDGYWSSRAPEFLQQDTVQTLLTWRAVPDTIFLAGIVILVIFSIRALFHLRKPTHQEGEALPVKDIASDE